AQGREWYRQYFTCTRNPLQKYLYFEATPEYLYRSKAADRIFQFNPKMKLIVLVREPVSRAYSAWNMYKDFLNRPSIPDVLTRGYLQNQSNQLYETLY